jgi:hypothetical protein
MQLDKINPINFLAILIYITLALVITSNVMAESEVYKYVDENGVVSYSSKPPTNETEAEAVDIPKGNIMDTELSDSEKEFRKENFKINSRINRSIEARKKQTREIKSAEYEVRKKSEELEQGRTPLPGERIGTVSGYSRLRPSYHERIKSLEEALAIAKKKLKALKEKYNQ